jgi:hypothetical protein
VRRFFAHVAGESFRNADGSERQAIIARCRVGEPLVLEHEPDNPHDINAIRVLRTTGEQIGYLTRELAGEVVSRGPGDFYAFVAGIGRADGGLYGVALLIIVADTDDDAAVERYADRVLAKDRSVNDAEPPAASRSRVERGSPGLTEDDGNRFVTIAVVIVLTLAGLVAAVLLTGRHP